MPSAGRASHGRVEDLLANVSSLNDSVAVGARIELWVPNALTMRGQPVQLEIAMTVVLDALLAKRYYPDGFETASDGRLYRYIREA